jgi:hypothetical protein
MTWDVVLHWMTHLQEGSWAGFRKAVANIVPAEADLDQICRSLRVNLSDLGHADFFVEGTQRWRVRQSVLAALPMKHGTAFLTGGKTPQFLDALKNVAEEQRCEITFGAGADSTTAAFVSGQESALRDIAADLNISYVPDFASVLCHQFVPLSQLLTAAPEERSPINWQIKSFDFQSMSWVDGLRLHSACECSSRFGVRRYYIYARRGALLRLPKREAVYASAMLQRIKLLDYDSSACVLSAPIAAPLPELLARAASLCSGAQARIERGYIRHTEIPPAVGAAILVASGQPFPKISALSAHGI